MELIDRDLSEPYSIFTYRYFVAQWPKLCFLAVDPAQKGGGEGAAAAAAAPAAREKATSAPACASASASAAAAGKTTTTATTTTTTTPTAAKPGSEAHHHRAPVLLPDGEGAAAGVVVCKAEPHRERNVVRGYLAMLVVGPSHRGRGLGAHLARLAIGAMAAHPCDEVALEAEAGNAAALHLYRALGFLRDKRLHRYYLNGADAYRLKLLLPRGRKLAEEAREEVRAAAAVAAGGGGGEEDEDEEGDEDEDEEEEEEDEAEEAAKALAGLELAAT